MPNIPKIADGKDEIGLPSIPHIADGKVEIGYPIFLELLMLKLKLVAQYSSGYQPMSTMSTVFLKEKEEPKKKLVKYIKKYNTKVHEIEYFFS